MSVMVVMVVMVMPINSRRFHMAMLLVAMLPFLLQLQSYMADAMGAQFPSNHVLDLMGFAACHHMHGGVMTAAVHAPNMDVVHIQDAVNFHKMLANLLNLDTVGRFFKKQIHCALVTVYLMFHLVSQYRLWSSESQLLIYFFPLMASIFLMLSAYHSAVLDLRKESRSGFVFFSQAALFFCMISIYSQSWLFYTTMSLWLATGLCSLQEEAPREEA